MGRLWLMGRPRWLRGGALETWESGILAGSRQGQGLSFPVFQTAVLGLLPGRGTNRPKNAARSGLGSIEAISQL